MRYKPILSIRELNVLEAKRQKNKDKKHKTIHLDDGKNTKLTLKGSCVIRIDCDYCPDRDICFDYNNDLFMKKKQKNDKQKHLDEVIL
jgi:hypothetical protein